MEFYWALKKIEIVLVTEKLSELEIIMLSKRNPNSERQILNVFSDM